MPTHRAAAHKRAAGVDSEAEGVLAEARGMVAQAGVSVNCCGTLMVWQGHMR